jgi:hypothetical protein
VTKRHFLYLSIPTVEKSQCNGKSRCLSGWAREGYLKFNELCMLVRQDWQQRARFEHELPAQLQQLAPPRATRHTQYSKRGRNLPC